MSLASMSVLVVIVGALLTFLLPSVLPEGLGPATTPAPTAAPAGTPTPIALPAIGISPPTPTPAPRVYQLRLDAGGSLATDVRVVSDDGLAVLTLARGTKVIDAQGQPLSSVTLATRALQLRVDIAVVSSAYEFGPEGAALDPPASLTIRYDPRANYPFRMQELTYPAFWQNIDASRVNLGYLAEKGPIPPLASVDSPTASVTAKIDRLGTIILYCVVF